MSVSTSFPDSTYSSSNKPSVETLKADIGALETAQNTHEALTEAHGTSGVAVGLTTLQAYVPVGVMFPYAGATAPSGFLLCDGTAVSRSTYSALFAIIGETYGAGDSSTTFNLPDTRGRVLVTKSSDTEFDALGETGGAKTVTLTEAQMPVHTHIQNSHDHNLGWSATGTNSSGSTGIESGGLTAVSSTTAVNQNAGSGEAHSNLQPYITVQHIIKT